MGGKRFRSLDEQIQIMESKGLIINDYEFAKNILFKENYFFLNGYRFLLMDNGKSRNFVEGSTFEELYSIFLFDRNIRNVLFKNLLIVENNFKSIISYTLSKKYGYKETDYLNPNNFTLDLKKNRQVKDLLSKMKRQIRINGKKHRATLHYLNNYGYIPMWVLVKVLSFGILSELYRILKLEDKEIIADYYGIDRDILGVYLPILANYRNLCAHEDILYDNRTQRVINDTMYHYELGIKKFEGEFVFGKNDLFSLIIMLKILLSKKEFSLMLKEIGYEVDKLEGKLDSVSSERILGKMGFPNNFREIIKM